MCCIVGKSTQAVPAASIAPREGTDRPRETRQRTRTTESNAHARSATHDTEPDVTASYIDPCVPLHTDLERNTALFIQREDHLNEKPSACYVSVQEHWVLQIS